MKEISHEQLTAHYLAMEALDPESRRRRLTKLRRSDPALWSELTSLLEQAGEVPTVLRTGAGLRLIDGDPPPPPHVGRYRILGEIGAGGMGIVYRAEWRDPEPRDVAIKILRQSAMGRYSRARFEIERRALGRMNHPNVARVLDGGVLRDGRPYVVMEYVDGEPITDYCDRNRLSIEDRLRLFLQVCQAVHHAHQQAILHRDIKPSNVLVSSVDGAPVPKVIDFGIAKPLEMDGADFSLTHTGQILGTPAYMSPEQALAMGEPVDIRTDVYSLGALLHELLVGTPPLDAGDLNCAGPEEVRRILLAADPPRPSVRLARAGPAAGDVAATRQEDPRSLTRSLRGELDWIVLKALARDRGNRYAAASELGADIKRFLGHQPLEARPPSAWYRARKLARRHRTVTALVLAIVPMVLAFSVTMAVMARRAAAERDREEALASFLVHFYEGPLLLPNRQGPRKPNVVMAEGLARLDRELGDRPVLRERVRRVIGSALEGFGGAGQALPILETAHERLRDQLGTDHPETLAAADAMGRALAQLWELGRAEAMWMDVLEARRRVLGDEHPDTLRTLVELGNLAKITGRYDQAVVALSEARTGLIKVLGWGDRDTGLAAAVLGAALLDARRLDESRAIIQEALQHLAPDHPERVFAIYNLACIHALRNERKPALARLREAVDAGFNLRFFSDGNLRSLFDEPEFLELNRSALLIGSKARTQIGGDARHLIHQGDYDAAERLLRAALDAMPRVRESDGFKELLSRVYMLQGRFREALPLVEQQLARVRTQHPEEPMAHVARMWRLAEVLAGLDRKEEALGVLEESRRSLENFFTPFLRSDLAYNRALAADVRGDTAGTLEALRDSVDAGLGRTPHILDGVAFRRIQSLPEYQAIIEIPRKRYAFEP